MQAPASQSIIQQDIPNVIQNVALNTRNSFGTGFFPNENGLVNGSIMVPKPIVETVMVPVTLTIPKQVAAPQFRSVQAPNPRYNPVSFGPNLRGVIFNLFIVLPRNICSFI